MRISLNGIGIIKNSEIIIDGLTVISGKNNSGKSSVGKALFAVLNATSDIPTTYATDRNNYINRSLYEVFSNELDFFRYTCAPFAKEKDSDIFYSDFPSLKQAVQVYYPFFRFSGRRTVENYEELAKNIRDELLRLSPDCFEGKISKTLMASHYYSTKEEGSIWLSNRISEAIKKIEKTFDFLQADSKLTKYVNERINRSLQIEFKKQIQPVSKVIQDSWIMIEDSEKQVCNIKISENAISTKEKSVYNLSYSKNVYLIDNPFLIDDLDYKYSESFFDLENASYVNSKLSSHSEQLKQILKDTTDKSVLEQIELNESLQEVNKKINSILPGQFDFLNEGNFYIKDGKKLALENLATGSKFFSIIKMLLDKGKLSDSTILILDEPECHLHPEWINIIAEIIVLLVKELGIKILVTTHNSNLILAIDAFMRKYQINNITKFYQTVANNDGTVSYSLANNLEQVYKSFLDDLLNAKVIRDYYIDLQEKNYDIT